MDEAERHPKRRKIYEWPLQAAMASGARPHFAEDISYQAPRVPPRELNREEYINGTSPRQALRKELKQCATAFQRILSKHMVKMKSKMSQLERENKELRHFACSLDKALQDAIHRHNLKTTRMVTRETQTNMALENDLKVSRGTQVNMRVVFRPVSLNGKDSAMPRLIALPSVHQDGSRKRQFVHLLANQETSGKSCVSNEVNETSAGDLVQLNSKDKALPDQKRMGNGSYPQTSASHTEGIPKRTISIYRNASPGGITTQDDQMWLSKSTNQAFNYTRRENVSREAIGPPNERNTGSIPSYCKETSGSVASKEITTQDDETRSSKPQESVHHHTSVDNASSQTAKTPIAVKTSSTSVHCYPSFGSVASKEITTRRDEVLVQNETFSRLSSSAATTSTIVPSVSKVGIESARSVSQLPKNPQKLPDAFGETNLSSKVPPPNKSQKPDVTRSVPHIIKDGFYNLDDSLHDTPSSHASSKKVLTVDDPVRPALDSGPFSIRRLLSSHKPSQKSQVTNASSCFPSLHECDLNKRGHLPGATSRYPSSLNGGFVRDKNPVKPKSTGDSFIIQNMHINNESSQTTNTTSSLSSLQSCSQSSSIVPTSSSFTSSRDSTAGRRNSNSLIVPSNRKSLDQEHFGMYGAPLQTTSSSFSQGIYKHNEPRQNVGPSNGPSAETICTNNSNRQNPGHAHEPKSQLHFHPGVIKIAGKTPQNRKLPAATVQAMTTLPDSLLVSGSVPSRERLNTSHNHSEPPRNRRNSTESTGNIQQWRHKDPKIQTKHKSYDIEALHLPGSTSSLLAPSTAIENSDLQTFVSYLTEPESSHIVSAMKEQELENSFDIGQEGQLLEMRTYYDSVQTQQVEILKKNQSMRVWTLQSDNNWISDDPNNMGTYNTPDIYESVTDRDVLPNYDDNMLQNLPYFSSCHSPADKQYTPAGFRSSRTHFNPQNGLHLGHCPMRQMKQLQLSHHRKRKVRSPYI